VTCAPGGLVTYVRLGTSNTSNATPTLSGTTAGAELLVKNANGASANAFGLYAHQRIACRANDRSVL